MPTNLEDTVKKALIRLQVLCETTRRSSFHIVGPMYVAEYEDVLQHLREAQVDVDGFDIPESAMPDLGNGDRNCIRDFFIMRLAGLLMHLARVAPHSGNDQAVAKRIMDALQPIDDGEVPW